MEEETDEIENVIQIITLVIDPDSPIPRLDIGSINPAMAYAFVKAAAEALYDCIPNPTVTWNGEVIADYAESWLDEDDDY